MRRPHNPAGSVMSGVEPRAARNSIRGCFGPITGRLPPAGSHACRVAAACRRFSVAGRRARGTCEPRSTIAAPGRRRADPRERFADGVVTGSGARLGAVEAAASTPRRDRRDPSRRPPAPASVECRLRRRAGRSKFNGWRPRRHERRGAAFEAQSMRSAWVTSTRAAARAGHQQAATATATSRSGIVR